MQKKVGGCKRKTISEGNKEEGKEERKKERVIERYEFRICK